MSSINQSYGTYVSDGVRSGPQYNGPIRDLASGRVYSTAYNAYGPGIMYSPTFTYNIQPYTAVANSICDVQNPAGASYLNLNSGPIVQNSAVTYLVDNNGVGYIQLDWPRALSLTCAAGTAAGINVTFFGADWYGFLMQSTVQTVDGASVIVPKAFWKIFSVYCNGVPLQNLSVSPLDLFGLPYAMFDSGCIGTLGWGNIPTRVMPTDNIIVPPAAINFGTAIASGVVLADPSLPTSAGYLAGTSYDVRGLLKIPTVPGVSNAVNELFLNYYVQGADVTQNQQNAMYRNAVVAARNNIYPGIWEAGVDLAGNRTAIQRLNVTNLYGQLQFYTGIPA